MTYCWVGRLHTDQLDIKLYCTGIESEGWNLINSGVVCSTSVFAADRPKAVAHLQYLFLLAWYRWFVFMLCFCVCLHVTYFLSVAWDGYFLWMWPFLGDLFLHVCIRIYYCIALWCITYQKLIMSCLLNAFFHAEIRVIYRNLALFLRFLINLPLSSETNVGSESPFSSSEDSSEAVSSETLQVET